MKEVSERLPGKNMRPLCGRPLFHWIMDTLQESGVIDEIIINTDSEKIADNAKKFADKTVKLLLDKKLRKSLSVNGKKFLEKNYSWDKIFKKLDSLL